MGEIVGIILLLGGTAGGLYNWVHSQREKIKRMDEVLLFFQKSIFAMESENIKLITYFSGYDCQDEVLKRSLVEIAHRLSQNLYPKGQRVWEEVLKEEEQNWAFDKESFGVLVDAGNGFFGRSREENICFLQKSLKELERQREKIKEKDAGERKVWVPVGMLGAVMLIIIFI